MGRMMSARSTLLIGLPGTGKTTMEVRITDMYIRNPGVRCVHVFDTVEQWSPLLQEHLGDLEAQLELLVEDELRVHQAIRKHGFEKGSTVRKYDGPLIRDRVEFNEYCQLLAEEWRDNDELQDVWGEPPADDELGTYPRRVIWRCGEPPVNYAASGALTEFINCGWAVGCFSESPDWFPPYKTKWPVMEIPERPDVRLEQLFTKGRAHIKDRHGERTGVSMVFDTQDLSAIHWNARQIATSSKSAVLCSQVIGNDTYQLLDRTYGQGDHDISKTVRELKPREWRAIWGTMPKLAPFRGGGR